VVLGIVVGRGIRRVVLSLGFQPLGYTYGKPILVNGVTVFYDRFSLTWSHILKGVQDAPRYRFWQEVGDFDEASVLVHPLPQVIILHHPITQIKVKASVERSSALKDAMIECACYFNEIGKRRLTQTFQWHCQSIARF